MRLRLNNEFRKFSYSSKNMNYADIPDITDNIQIKNLDRSFAFHEMKNNKKLSNNPPVNNGVNESRYRKSKKKWSNYSFIYI